jgi:hypothetical protein
LTDIAGILAAHELISIEELRTARLLAHWLTLVRVAFGLRNASVGGLWHALLAGGGRTGLTPLGTDDRASAGDAALSKLDHLHRVFGALDQLGRLGLVLRVASGESWPADARDLAELRTGLAVVSAMQERARPRTPAHLARAQ